jgi:hypothetical protein
MSGTRARIFVDALLRHEGGALIDEVRREPAHRGWADRGEIYRAVHDLKFS